MQIFIGADHGGFGVKEQLKEQLRRDGHEVTDCGATTLDPNDDYPVYGEAVGRAVAEHPGSRGIALCRSGHGMVISANKVDGARAVLATTPAWTNQSVEHDAANVLAIGVDFVDAKQIYPLVEGWLAATFVGGKHQRRVDEITAEERGVW